MNLVFVTDELPRPGVAGHLGLNFAIIEWLQALGHRVVVLLVGARLAAPVVKYEMAEAAGPGVWRVGAHLVARAPHQILARAAVRALPAGLSARLRRARHGADAVLGSFTSAEDIAWCARYVARAAPDAVLIDTMFRAGLLAAPELQGKNSVVVAHDVFHRRHAALAGAGYRVQPATLTRADEAAWLSHARHIAAIQPEEANLLAAMCPMQNVFTAPMPAAPCPRPAGLAVIPRRLAFAGSATLPNIDGLRWFLLEVWPLLENVSLDLVGACGAGIGAVPQGVARLGRVPELAPYLHRAALAVAPLRVGSGLKIKLLDYARHGLHTVATPASLEGFAADDCAPFTQADDQVAFAAAIMRLLNAPPAAEPALAYVTRHYSAEACFSPLRAALGA